MTTSSEFDPSTPSSRIVPHFSRTRDAGDLVFVSGQLPFDANQTVIEGDVAEQTRQCLRNIEASLEATGLTLAHVVKTTVWLARIEDFLPFNAAYGAAFQGATLPARSTVRADLMVPGALVEIEAIAHRG
ncbi:RidA family protein [Achromobacter sp. GG226]|uniref:RidA family protein n=1 Tax=Verticiella alkaliphila TaxID=2779529 RepID=UPI001C0BDE3E|nr:RidA family protein [Verticiella sp. GG226]MBU4612253.1 RidA family protein [Verticiella sp. GG226]